MKMKDVLKSIMKDMEIEDVNAFDKKEKLLLFIGFELEAIREQLELLNENGPMIGRGI